jgi:hypothetical protein
MKKAFLALTGVAVAMSAAPTFAKDPKTFVCTKWENGVCTSTHRVRGTPPGYKVGYVFGPDYSYTTYANIPQQVVTHYKLDPAGRYVYTDGYVYVVDPATYAVSRVIDVMAP